MSYASGGTGAAGTTVATDTLWDAAGDLAVGTGADTAAKLTIGATSAFPRVVGGTVAWVAASAATPAVTAATGSAGTAANPPSADNHAHVIGSGSVGVGMTLTAGVLTATPATSQVTDGRRRTGSIQESFSRVGATVVNNAALTLGTVLMMAVDVASGTTITSTTWVSGTQALVAGTSPHLWGIFCDSSRVVKAVTADDTSPVWAASSEHVFTFGAQFVTTYSGLHYVGIMHMGTTATAPSLLCVAHSGTLVTLAPIVGGTSNTAQTTPPALATTMTAITPQGPLPYMYVS